MLMAGLILIKGGTLISRRFVYWAMPFASKCSMNFIMGQATQKIRIPISFKCQGVCRSTTTCLNNIKVSYSKAPSTGYL